jgi:hypothetical protein
MSLLGNVQLFSFMYDREREHDCVIQERKQTIQTNDYEVHTMFSNSSYYSYSSSA